MAFTVGEAFDLLFGSEATRGGTDGNAAVGYEDRRWFRRPLPVGLNDDQLALLRWDAERAETILKQKILSSLPSWRARLRKAKVPGAFERISERKPNLKAKLSSTLDAARHVPPRSPYDVFAIAAFLIDAAGIYHHIQPEKVELPSKHGGGTHRNDSPRHLHICQADRDLVCRVAKAWRELDRQLIFRETSAQPLADHIVKKEIWADLEPLFESWAVVFSAYAEADLFIRLSTNAGNAEPAPGWWHHVWRLFAISDEAARGTGFNFDDVSLKSALAGENSGLEWFEAELFAEFATRIHWQNKSSVGNVDQPADILSLSVARSEMVGVLPKVRTPSVGCTLRSLSHHLALTPGRGVARGRWTPNFVRQIQEAGLLPDGEMNILLVPLPYSIEARAFCGSLVEVAPTRPLQAGRVAKPRFGYFDVHQHWLDQPDGWNQEADKGDPWEDEHTKFLRSLISAARKHCPTIHAIVFPELALNQEAFDKIRAYLEEHVLDVELLIAGVSEKTPRGPGGMAIEVKAGDSPAKRHGNFVAIASFNRGQGTESLRQSVREKHHRWKLNRTQLRDYGLLGVLSPEIEWWENIALQSRRVDFTVIRQRSVLSAMICEDLARVDPCQQIVRSVAPNLVVALLMDAPQRGARWPSRYATVLAEDPGCAVLTLTSRGMMTRQHRLGLFPSKGGDDRIIALWRDDQSDPIELACPYDAQGVLLSIVEEDSEDISLDGRSDTSAMAFRYAGHVPVRIPNAKTEFSHILGEEDRAC